MINELCKDVIGEYQITLDSKPENSDEWKAAKEALDDPDFLYEEIVNKFRAGYSGWLKKGNENTHFVTLIWVRTKIAERINYYIS